MIFIIYLYNKKGIGKQEKQKRGYPFFKLSNCKETPNPQSIFSKRQYTNQL